MICPGYGAENPDESGMCSLCGYKYEIGKLYSDPKNMRFYFLPKNGTKKKKFARFVFLSMLLLIGVIIILSFVEIK
jgi:hypothetical protein